MSALEHLAPEVESTLASADLCLWNAVGAGRILTTQLEALKFFGLPATEAPDPEAVLLARLIATQARQLVTSMMFEIGRVEELFMELVRESET